MTLIEQLKEANERAELAMGCEQAKAEEVAKLQAQLDELQPYPRGAEGWYSEGKAWVFGKALYVTKYKHSHLIMIDGITFETNDFTTENPHKKKTVLCTTASRKDLKQIDLDSWLDSQEFAVMDECKHDGVFLVLFSKGIGCCTFYVTQIGDDLQAKFDDPNDKKYTSLI